MRANNTPQNGLSQIQPEKVKMIVSDLMELHELGACENDQDVEERIQLYFQLCRNTSIRPGVESLAAALHCDRATVWRWEQGQGCTPRRTEAIKGAKAMISAFVEQAALSGQLNPVSAIFLMKNWMRYTDSYLLDTPQRAQQYQGMTPEEIAAQIEADIPLDEDFTS